MLMSIYTYVNAYRKNGKYVHIYTYTYIKNREKNILKLLIVKILISRAIKKGRVLLVTTSANRNCMQGYVSQFISGDLWETLYPLLISL